MKKFICLLMCLVLLPVCAFAEPAFTIGAEGFQWHLSDMLERYIVWESMGMVNGKPELFGYPADGGEPNFVIRTDSSDRLYSVSVSAILDPVYNQYTLESMDAVLDSAQTVAHTIALLTRYEADIEDLFRTGDIHELYRQVRNNQSLSSYTTRKYSKTWSAPGIICTQELSYINSSRMFYEIAFYPDR